MKNIEWSDSFFIQELLKSQNFTDKVRLFKSMLWDFYAQHQRSFVWREEITPYRILISEVMLQQTQVERVEQKFISWLVTFSTIESLAQAQLFDVLAAWSGLGYNRRARFLLESAQMIVEQWKGQIPQDPQLLVQLPGIGVNTAGSIAAFAYNKPTLFLETNVKAVLIHYFFMDQEKVSDEQLLAVLTHLLDHERPRDFYYALMDLGTWVKKTYKNPTQRSSSYTKQSPFVGSVRRVRGAIIKTVLADKKVAQDLLAQSFKDEHELFIKALDQLESEKLVVIKNNFVEIL